MGIFIFKGWGIVHSPNGRAYFDSNSPNLKETRIGKWASVSFYHCGHLVIMDNTTANVMSCYANN